MCYREGLICYPETVNGAGSTIPCVAAHVDLLTPCQLIRFKFSFADLHSDSAMTNLCSSVMAGKQLNLLCAGDVAVKRPLFVTRLSVCSCAQIDASRLVFFARPHVSLNSRVDLPSLLSCEFSVALPWCSSIALQLAKTA